MPKITAASIALTALVLLSLTACAETPETAPSEPVVSGESVEEETAAPLVAETPEDAPAEDAEAAFVEDVRDNLRPANVIPNATDEQLIDAGHAACQAVASGTPTDQISVIEGEEAEDSGYFTDSLVIVQATSTTLCPR